MKRLATIIIMTVMIQNLSFAQELEALRGFRTTMNGTIYDFDESEAIFKQVPIAHQKYLKSKKSRKASKAWGYTSLSSLGVGLILMATPSLENCHGVLCLSPSQAVGVLSVFLVFPITGTIGLISRVNWKTRLRNATEFYNSNRNLGYHKKEFSLSFGLAQNGIGLMLNF